MSVKYNIDISMIVLLFSTAVVYGMRDRGQESSLRSSHSSIKKSASHDHLARTLHEYEANTRSSHLQSKRSYAKQEVYHSDARRLHLHTDELPVFNFNSDDESGRRQLKSHPYWDTCDRTQVAERNEWHQQPQPVIEVSLGNEFLCSEPDLGGGDFVGGPRQHMRHKGGRRGSHPDDNVRSVRNQQYIRGRRKSFAEGDAFGQTIAHHKQGRNFTARPAARDHSLGVASMHSAAAFARENHGHTHGLSRQGSVASMHSAAQSVKEKYGHAHGHTRRDSIASMHSTAASARQKHGRGRGRRSSGLSGDILDDGMPAGSSDMLGDDLSQMAYSVPYNSADDDEDEVSYSEYFSDEYGADEPEQDNAHAHHDDTNQPDTISFAQFYEDFREDFHGTPYFLPMIFLLFAYNQYPKFTVASIVCAGGVAIWKHDVLLRWWRDAKEKTNDSIDFTRKSLSHSMEKFNLYKVFSHKI